MHPERYKQLKMIQAVFDIDAIFGSKQSESSSVFHHIIGSYRPIIIPLSLLTHFNTRFIVHFFDQHPISIPFKTSAVVFSILETIKDLQLSIVPPCFQYSNFYPMAVKSFFFERSVVMILPPLSFFESVDDSIVSYRNR
jgi:hypothetical protein